MKRFWISITVICAVAGGGFYWWQSKSPTNVIEAAAGKVLGSDAKGAKGEGKSAKGEGKGAGRRGGGPITVRTITVKREPVPVIIEAVGSIESEHSVTIRPQASGVLQAVMFKEGDRVKQGQLLFRIDPRPMQAAVEQAKGAVARDQAQIVQARAQEARLRPLMEKDYITRQEYDVAATSVKTQEATAEANRAILEQAQLQLAYTQITSPISGRTGSLMVKAGNLVTIGANAAPLVVINSTQPILASLSVPQRYLDDVRRAWNTPDLKVEVSPNPDAPAVAQGSLVFIDNSVNPQTGTIVVKARIKNEKEELWPGQFIAARIILRVEQNAVVVPEAAVQPGQDGPFVYVVRDNKAMLQPVQVARQVNDQMVISKGLSGGEQVIIEVPLTLAAGAAVQIRDDSAAPRKGGSGASDGATGDPEPQAERKSRRGKS